MPNVDVVTLDPKGFVSDQDLKMNLLFSHALEANHSQCFNQYDGVTSIQYIVAKYAKNFIILAEKLETKLTYYYEKHFDEVTVEVNKSNYIDEEHPEKVTFDILIETVQDGRRSVLSKTLQETNDESVIRILKNIEVSDDND